MIYFNFRATGNASFRRVDGTSAVTGSYALLLRVLRVGYDGAPPVALALPIAGMQ